MMKIEGFGTAEWSVMMGSVSFRLEGTDAHVVVRPENKAASSPNSWPGQVGKILAPGDSVTADKVRAAFPNLTAVEWNDRVVGLFNGVECFGLFDDLRITVVSHIHGVTKPTEDQRAKKHAELRALAEEFIKILAP
jgi:hypothetical protein